MLTKHYVFLKYIFQQSINTVRILFTVTIPINIFRKYPYNITVILSKEYILM